MNELIKFIKILEKKFSDKKLFGYITPNFRPHMPIDDILKISSLYIDDYINQHKEENLRFVGGYFKITLLGKKFFNMKIELYFQDDTDEWKTYQETSDAMRGEDWLSPESWQELQKVNEKIYDVEAPQ